ncbi:MAG TPA: ATP-dependent zinc metalloprotease FtsH [Anaerolineales bacterium]|nr:ATP-dependent zinc metalloprotease FtsH [Anaerolineales bacterium]
MNNPSNSNPNKPDQDEDQQRQEQMRRQMRYSLSYLFVAMIVLWLFQEFILTPLMVRATELTYSDFRQKLADNEIVSVEISDTDIMGQMKNPDPNSDQATIPFDTIIVPGSDPTLVEDLQSAGVEYSFSRPQSPAGALLLSWILPLGLLGVFWYFIYRRSAGAGGLGGILGVGRSKATEVKAEEVGVNYKDVGGADEAIAELQEIIQFLKSPEMFARLGGRIPKGVLLVGPPGTGKTLLAKATAGEAHVSFFETSGSEFVEMFVGVGAARVRDLFIQARQAAPAIIFIDEIDAIGQSRAGTVRLGGNDEREQTLNQLLAEIDGFQTGAQTPVIIMAATNRPEVLDQALLRAGRFDRQITVGNPDLIGRKQILAIHSRGIKLAEDFDMERAARITPGFSGADLANVVNEAALLAARRNADAVTLEHFEQAIERVVAGLEQRTRVMNERERQAVAYHESGHALVAELVPHGDPVSKISIIPRSRGSLGYTMQMPTEDRYLLTVEELEDRIAVMLAGRAAEKVVFGTISTGAGDDIQRATDLARRMITEFGMSEQLGSVRYAGQQLQYLGGVMQDTSNVSPKTAELIDQEIQRTITSQYERAQNLLREHRLALETLTQELLKNETLDGSAVSQALSQPADN